MECSTCYVEYLFNLRDVTNFVPTLFNLALPGTMFHRSYWKGTNMGQVPHVSGHAVLAVGILAQCLPGFFSTFLQVTFFPLYCVDQSLSSWHSGVGIGFVIGSVIGIIGSAIGSTIGFGIWFGNGLGPLLTGTQKSIRALKLMNPFDCSKSSAVVIIPEAL